MNERIRGRTARSDMANRPSDQRQSNMSGEIASTSPLDPNARQQMVAEAAYYLAERRQFESGQDMDDWLEAERQIETAIAQQGSDA